MNNNFIPEIYVIAIVAFVAFMLISIVVANAISYQLGEHPTDGKKRKLWFWVFGVLTFVTAFLANYFMVYNSLSVPKQQDAAMLHQSIAAVVAFVLYVVLGVILSKSMKRSKLGSWF